MAYRITLRQNHTSLGKGNPTTESPTQPRWVDVTSRAVDKIVRVKEQTQQRFKLPVAKKKYSSHPHSIGRDKRRGQELKHKACYTGRETDREK